MVDANSKITHKSPRKEAPNSSLVNFFRKTPTKPSFEEPIVEEQFTIDAKIPEVITEVIAKSAVVPQVEMAEEPKLLTETDEVMKEPAKPKVKASSKRESKPEPEIPAEVKTWKEKVETFQLELNDLINAAQLERETWVKESGHLNSNLGPVGSETAE
jgi:hypothetical protein